MLTHCVPPTVPFNSEHMFDVVWRALGSSSYFWFCRYSLSALCNSQETFLYEDHLDFGFLYLIVAGAIKFWHVVYV